MANENNQNTQNTSSTTDFGGEQNKAVNTGQNFGSSSGTAASAKPAKESDSSKGVLDQAKKTAGQAYELATEKATTKLEEQKTTLAGGLTSVADSLKQTTGSLRDTGEQNPIAEFTAKYGESFANQIEKVGQYFEQKDVRAMVRDVESFARRNPAVFIGAAFGLGFLAARFLKSTPKQLTSGAGQSSFDASESFGGSGTQTASNPS